MGRVAKAVPASDETLGLVDMLRLPGDQIVGNLKAGQERVKGQA